MPIFAPPYRPSAGQETYLARQDRCQKRKRRRDTDSSSSSSPSNNNNIINNDDDDTLPKQKQASSNHQTPTWTSHPVSKTDPYNVAGHSREEALPPPPFPHAAIKTEPHFRSKASIEEELAGLKPPVYALRDDNDEGTNPTSLRRRHLDNMTAILHSSLMRGDWERAMRAWSLLIRTDVAGLGVDLRRNGRWGIGAELLMRSKSMRHERKVSSDAANNDDSDEHDDDGDDSPFSDAGFELAKQYYERLVLQYPHTRTTQYTFNATQIYPVFFGVWIYQAQERSLRTKRRLDRNSRRNSFAEDHGVIDGDDRNSVDSVSAESKTRQTKAKELEDADAIAQRMDDLLLGPPYDTDHQLVLLRAMVELWRADLHEDLQGAEKSSTTPSDDEPERFVGRGRHDDQAREGRARANEMLSKLVAMGADVPDELQVLAT